jgi:hypothetical protein
MRALVAPDRAPADLQRGSAARREPAFVCWLDAQRYHNRSPEAVTLTPDRGGKAAALSSGKTFLELRLHHATDLGERNIDRDGGQLAPFAEPSTCAGTGNRSWWDEPGFGLHAECEGDADWSMRGCAAGARVGPQLQP